jgi:hypothetical protein
VGYYTSIILKELYFTSRKTPREDRGELGVSIPELVDSNNDFFTREGENPKEKEPN